MPTKGFVASMAAAQALLIVIFMACAKYGPRKYHIVSEHDIMHPASTLDHPLSECVFAGADGYSEVDEKYTSNDLFQCVAMMT
jgi:hypothetical protein